MNIKSVEALQAHLNSGHTVKYLCFWGHQEKLNRVTKSCFSQWYTSPFESQGVVYPTAEHFMMAQKARLFNDDRTCAKIIKAASPGEAKSLGREVTGFDDALWQAERFNIVVKANELKFAQRDDLREFLLNTGDRVLVEASPVDRVWGVGLAADDPNIEAPGQWDGLNLLGFALMEVRDRLRK